MNMYSKWLDSRFLLQRRCLSASNRLMEIEGGWKCYMKIEWYWCTSYKKVLTDLSVSSISPSSHRLDISFLKEKKFKIKHEKQKQKQKKKKHHTLWNAKNFPTTLYIIQHNHKVGPKKLIDGKKWSVLMYYICSYTFLLCNSKIRGCAQHIRKYFKLVDFEMRMDSINHKTDRVHDFDEMVL